MSLVTEWDRESSLRVVMGESVDDLEKSGKSVWSVGVFFVCCGGGTIWDCRSGGAGDLIISSAR